MNLSMTNVILITAAHRKASSFSPTSASQTDNNASANLKINSGDIVRIHTNGEVPVTAARCGVNFIFRTR